MDHPLQAARAAARAAPRATLLRGGILLRPLVLLLVVVLPALWLTLVAAPSLRVEVGAWGDHTYLSGVNGIERSSTEDYRWTTGDARLALPDLSGRYRLLVLRAHGWRPEGLPSPVVSVEVSGRSHGTFGTTPGLRLYRVLLPEETTGPTQQLGLRSDIYRPPGDPRSIGVALDWVELRALGSAGPNLWQLGGQLLLLASLVALVAALGLPPWTTALAAATLLVAALWANLRGPLWVGQALVPWIGLALGLLAATWWVGPRVRACLADGGAPWMSHAQARAAWALLVAALGVRLAGSVHPLFNAHDVDVHMRWLDTVVGGEWYLYSTPSEARNSRIFNPPAGYALLLPLALLLPSARLVVQVGVALADALGCLLLLLIARELRLPARAGLLALAAYVALPINLTILWWGFATNVVAQALWLLLLWQLSRLLRLPSAGGAAVLGVIAAVTLMTHVGALFLTAAALGLLLGLLPVLHRRGRGVRRGELPVARRPEPGFGAQTVSPAPAFSAPPLSGWRLALAAVGLALLLTLVLYFAAAAGPLLGPAAGAEGGAASSAPEVAAWATRMRLAARAAIVAFGPLALALAPPGLALLALQRKPTLLPALLTAWIGACLLFFGVHLATGLLTRYLYFAAPLICLAGGAALARMSRGSAGLAVTIATVLAIALPGVSLWVQGVLLRVKPSALPLSH